MGFIALVFSIIIFCVFIGMFTRLGRIEQILKQIAINGGTKEKDIPSKWTVLKERRVG